MISFGNYLGDRLIQSRESLEAYAISYQFSATEIRSSKLSLPKRHSIHPTHARHLPSILYPSTFPHPQHIPYSLSFTHTRKHLNNARPHTLAPTPQLTMRAE